MFRCEWIIYQEVVIQYQHFICEYFLNYTGLYITFYKLKLHGTGETLVRKYRVIILKTKSMKRMKIEIIGFVVSWFKLYSHLVIGLKTGGSNIDIFFLIRVFTVVILEISLIVFLLRAILMFCQFDLFHLHPPVLEPNFDLSFTETQTRGDLVPLGSGEVFTFLKLRLQLNYYQ